MLGRRSCTVSGLGDAAWANGMAGCGTGRRPRGVASVVDCVGSRCVGVRRRRLFVLAAGDRPNDPVVFKDPC